MIYLDHAAATPVDKRVFEAMRPYFLDDFFNPSAAYLPAKKVVADYEAAKGTIAHAIGAKASDIVITAGATEANNLAMVGVLTEMVSARAAFARPVATGGRRSSSRCRAPEALRRDISATQTSSSKLLYLVTEHDSVRKVAERYGGQAIKVLPNGLIDLDDLRAKITDETELVSVSLVNNELGTIQPMTEIAGIIREERLNRMKAGNTTPIYLHSDASQALNLLDINVARLVVDLMTLNAAKIYGPKGVGALYVAHGVKLQPITQGGEQENGMRSGTENVPGVIGFAKAVEIAKGHLNGNRKKYAGWRKILLSELKDYELINKKHALDNFVVLCYNCTDAERLIYLLEDRGICVSTGAACAASKGVRSHVLTAIGLSDAEIAGSLRLTMGETNTEEQIHEAARIINEVVANERERISRE